MPEPFKNLINRSTVDALADLAVAAYPAFNHKRFRKTCVPAIDALELKDRAKLLGEALWSELPQPPAAAFECVGAMIRQIPTRTDDGAQDAWLLFPINALFAAHGLEAFKTSLKLLPELTKRFTAEFGIRCYLIAKPSEMLTHLHRWSRDKNEHVRRLVSEGSRPRLPWAEQITAFISDPSPLFPLLEKLKDDRSEYVRRSVANNLNDISKDHPDLMLDVVENWLPDASPQRLALIRHACRTLIKEGHPRCMALLGHGTPSVKVDSLVAHPSSIALGERIALTATIEATGKSDQSLVVDFRFHLVKANGKTAPKVFKGAKVNLLSGSARTISKTFHLKAVTTRKYYTGINTVDLLVNGLSLASCQFHLTAS